ncbi:hypothetical protein MLD38_002587 [Melastoma candidum]|uniref:Uncharacterized protein n=1 Tax=Melastoma candidum TaxID=119954 RepID=A0ACB9S1C8_9MYRT|nr:hypothetical protein MLD38_002587 [Melastoma candidum]
MVSGNDPIESLTSTFQSVKCALLPLESGLRKTVEDMDWLPGRKNKDGGGGGDLVEELSGYDKNGKFQIHLAKKKNVPGVVSDEGRKGFSIKIPIRFFSGGFSNSLGNVGRVEGEKDVKESKDSDCTGTSNESCTTCLQFSLHLSLLANSFLQALPSPFKSSGKKGLQKHFDEDKMVISSKSKVILKESKCRCTRVVRKNNFDDKDGKHVSPDSLEVFLGVVLDLLAQNLQKFDQFMPREYNGKSHKVSTVPDPPARLDHLRAVATFWEGRKSDVNGFFGSLKFARVGGVPSGIIGVACAKDDSDDAVAGTSTEELAGGSPPQKLGGGILSIPLSNVERLKSTLSTVSFTELIELVPYLGRSPKEYPDKKKLISVQDFFRYTESEGRRFFEELDGDGDGQVTLEDLEIAMGKRKLPRRYAREFMSRARSHFFSKSFGWKQFLTLMEQREPTILRAYTSLCLSKSGTLQKSEILESLQRAGLPANEDHADAMMRCLVADKEGSISYGHFRNFMLLLPSDRLQDDPRNVWFEAATVVAVAPPMEIPAGSVLRSALAGGLSCALSTSLMHPVDTIKTRVQASSLSFGDIIGKIPEIGARGLYRGSLPAIWGQFSSHGLRTGIFEASKLILINVAPSIPDIQVQSLASFCSTFLGTAVRIPCEVLKQRLQAGLFDNVGEALIATWQQDGPKGFFRGTGATLCREVPFYVAGMGLYEESKKLVQRVLGRDLEPWETIAVGALSGGLAAIVTTPFDVMKTRMMTARGRSLPMSMVAITILRREGPLGLFKGAVPRFFWIAPLGAMNFAGYELARKAMMNKNQEAASVGNKKLASSR